MRKITFLLTCTAMFISINCLKAQTVENTSISANATVLSALSISKNNDVNFGNISATTTGEVFLDPQGVASNYVGTAASAGKLTITGDGSQSIRLGWPGSVTLTDDDSHELTLTFAVAGNGSDNQSTSADLMLGGGYSTVNLVSGVLYLWVGGSLGTLDSQSPGTYTGTADFTIEYN